MGSIVAVVAVRAVGRWSTVANDIRPARQLTPKRQMQVGPGLHQLRMTSSECMAGNFLDQHDAGEDGQHDAARSMVRRCSADARLVRVRAIQRHRPHRFLRQDDRSPARTRRTAPLAGLRGSDHPVAHRPGQDSTVR